MNDEEGEQCSSLFIGKPSQGQRQRGYVEGIFSKDGSLVRGRFPDRAEESGHHELFLSCKRGHKSHRLRQNDGPTFIDENILEYQPIL